MNKLYITLLLITPLLAAPKEMLEGLVEAMAWVESRHDPKQHNIKEDAVGYLQIRPIMIDEVNRLLEKEGSSTRYTHKHAWDKKCSIEIFENWVRLNKYKDPEIIARNWNGGYSGINKNSTIDYWMKVKIYYNEKAINKF